MNLSLSDTLQEQRRKSLLTGRPLTPQEMSGITSGYFGTQARMSNQNWAQRLREKELEDQKARELEMMKAGKEQSKMAGISNIAENAITKLGTNYLTSKPGESMIAKGADLAKAGIDKIGGWFGSEAPTFTAALQAPAGEVGASMLGGANMAEAALPSVGGEVAVGAAEGVGSSLGSGLSTLGGAIGTAASIAAPYYALAKAGGMIVNAISNNNPWVRDTPLGALGRSLKNPITGVERAWGEMFAEHGVGDKATNEAIAAIFNPVGALFEEIGLGSWLCTATRNVVGLGQSEAETMKALKKYADENHKGWLTFYLKYGTILTRLIAEQENDLAGFYENLRRTLIEPVCKIFWTEPEKAYQVYYFITKTLFRAYMPELEIKEID